MITYKVEQLGCDAVGYLDDQNGNRIQFNDANDIKDAIAALNIIKATLQASKEQQREQKG